MALIRLIHSFVHMGNTVKLVAQQALFDSVTVFSSMG